MKFSVIRPMMMRLAGLFVPGARASVEMMYEFTESFVVDSSQMETVFGLKPTAVEVGLERTVKWYKTQMRG
jgi:nucleoside-diphosphate-sugar epimerase